MQTRKRSNWLEKYWLCKFQFFHVAVTQPEKIYHPNCCNNYFYTSIPNLNFNQIKLERPLMKTDFMNKLGRKIDFLIFSTPQWINCRWSACMATGRASISHNSATAYTYVHIHFGDYADALAACCGCRGNRPPNKTLHYPTPMRFALTEEQSALCCRP